MVRRLAFQIAGHFLLASSTGALVVLASCGGPAQVGNCPRGFQGDLSGGLQLTCSLSSSEAGTWNGTWTNNSTGQSVGAISLTITPTSASFGAVTNGQVTLAASGQTVSLFPSSTPGTFQVSLDDTQTGGHDSLSANIAFDSSNRMIATGGSLVLGSQPPLSISFTLTRE